MYVGLTVLYDYNILNSYTVQLNLTLHMHAGTYVCLHIQHMQNFKNWHVNVLQHAILASTHEIVNTRNTQEMHVTNLHLVCHITCVM